MACAWRNFKIILSRPLFIIIFRPKILFFITYSILTGQTKVEFAIYWVLSHLDAQCMSVDSIGSQRIPFMATTYLYLSYWAIYILCSENNHLSSRRLEHRQTIFSRDLISYFTLIWSKESNVQENRLMQIA